MSETFQPHPRFAVPVLEQEIERLRGQLAGAQDQILYLTAIINHQQADHEAIMESIKLKNEVAQGIEERDKLGGGAE